MKAKRYRAVLAVVVALLATLWVNTASYAAKIKAPTYKPAQLELIQRYVPPVAEMQDRLTQLEPLIDTEKWIDVRDFIHGPLGELRIRTGRVVRSLLGSDQKAAQQAEDSLFKHLLDIDTAAADRNYDQALSGYQAALQDLDKFLSLVPQVG
jgi:photosystem II protein PsbQ